MFQGTEKQVKWAESIKSDMLNKIDKMSIENNSEITNLLGISNEIDPRYVELKSFIESCDSAKWFIKNRNTPLSVLAQNKKFWKLIP